MNSFRFYCRAIAAGSLLLSAPAFAQNEDLYFDGFYVSGFGGVGLPRDGNDDRLEFDRNNDGTYGDTVSTGSGADAFSPGFCSGAFLDNVPTAGCRKDRKRFEFGGRLGFDVQSQSGLVIGALLEASRSNSTESTTGFSTTPAAYEVTRRIPLAVSARARIGFTPADRLLIYGTGGASYARIRHDFRTTNGANAFTEVNDRKWGWGWQAGGGVEFALSRNISIGAEYLRSSYKDRKYYVAVTQGTAPATNPFLLAGGQTNLRSDRGRYSSDSIRGTLTFRFGGAREEAPPPPPRAAPPPPPPPPPPQTMTCPDGTIVGVNDACPLPPPPPAPEPERG